MTYNGLMSRLNAFGAVLMLSVALSNTSCSSSRRVLESTKRETQTEGTVTVQQEKQTQTEQAQSREESAETFTVTEIEIYDTGAAPDPKTGARPLKAKIRQRTDHIGASCEATTYNAKEDTEIKEKQTYNGGELAEVVVKAERPPSLWERIRNGVMCGVAIIILAVTGWIIYKLKKR